MKAKILILLSIVGFITYGCNKNTSGKALYLDLVSVSADSVNLLDSLYFNFKISHDFNGTANDSLAIKIKYSPNCSFRSEDNLGFKLPNFEATKNQLVDMKYTYLYGRGAGLNGCSNNTTIVSDSVQFYFCLVNLRDTSYSDTIITKKICLKK